MTLTVPLPPEVGLARAVAGALPGAALQGAVEAVPAGHAEAGAVLALPVHRAAVVAGTLFAAGAAPALVADTRLVLAPRKDKETIQI